MKRKTILLGVTAFGFPVLASGLALGKTGADRLFVANGGEASYGMSFGPSKNKLHDHTGNVAYDGEATLKTDLGNDVRFGYGQIKGGDSSWQTLGVGGYFYNIDPLHGMESMSVSFKISGLSYKILYSRDASFDQNAEFVSSADSAQTFDFGGYAPNYIKILNADESDLVVSSAEINFSCLDDYHLLSLVSKDETRGSVIGGGTMVAGENVTIEAEANEGYVFEGWYSGGILVSDDNPYAFTMPSSDLSLEARFAITEAEKERRKTLGMDPVIDSENGTLTYGLYPQTHVKNDDVAEALDDVAASQSPQGNGWYLYDGKYYARKLAAPDNSGYVFDDGVKIVSGTTYWFECKPITWKILSSDGGVYSLVSAILLDAHRYDDSSNDYGQSEIRTWLNADFRDSAFSLDKTLIQTITVDNSASTTDSNSNSYACSNTYDDVYLLSYKDYSNAEYFANSAARRCKTTDWARANGAYSYPGSSYLYNGYYWTRSPYSSYSHDAWLVYDDGYLYSYYVDFSRYCVRPALTINLQ